MGMNNISAFETGYRFFAKNQRGLALSLAAMVALGAAAGITSQIKTAHDYNSLNIDTLSENGYKSDLSNKTIASIQNVEKTLKELGDKVSGEEKAKVETEIDNVKKALEGTDIDKIKEATEKLTQAFYEVSEKLYKQANPNAGAEGFDPSQFAGAQGNAENTENTANDGNVYDADYKVENDDNK